MKKKLTSAMLREVKSLRYLFVAFIFLLGYGSADAATLSVSPSTGVYQVGSTFSVRVTTNTQGAPINAADASISFNPSELSVVSINRSGSIFNLWVAEPVYSNSAGTINFSGGVPSGYTGGAGTVMTITFRANTAGTGRVSFSGGSVLANDGRGTNVLTAMSGGNYTIQAASSAPEPEVIEYIAPANTPAAPTIDSTTHPDPDDWHPAQTAELSWTVPTGVTGVRTLLDRNPTSVPTKVYESPITSISLDDLPQGESYFHIQFRNADGWGRVTHYRLAVDSEKPESFTISHPDDADFANPYQTLELHASDTTSGVERYFIKIDADEPYEFLDETASGTVTLPLLEPGYHSVIIEAFDLAGNSLVSTYSFTVLAFDRPVFTDYPETLNQEVIPVIKGSTRPLAEVELSLLRVGTEPVIYKITADDAGVFTFIPEGRFSLGVYELTAVATDQYGAKSEQSGVVRIAVQEAGYVKIGSFLVNVLSVLVPLIALIALLFLILLFVWRRFFVFRKEVRTETIEALDILHREFSNLHAKLHDHETKLQQSRKTKKLTKAEAAMIEAIDQALTDSQHAVEKEIEDVTNIT